jgi:geranylgeranylglycerol-phosphate geranylgeranyltransferase
MKRRQGSQRIVGSLFAMMSANKKRTLGKNGASKKQISLIQSQSILFESRRKWGILYSSATVAGLLCIPGFLLSVGKQEDFFVYIYTIVSLPLISLLIATGMYILNDLVDIDLDKANLKSRPLASGIVSKKQAWFFIISTNSAAILLSFVIFDLPRIIIIVSMIAIGIMYSAPKVALMSKFLLKTLSIAIFYMLCALLGLMSSFCMAYTSTNMGMPIHAVIMLGLMIFISSTINDLGDIKGDKAAGRRTLPIVLGANGTIDFLMILAMCMLAISWILFGMSIGVGLISAVSTSVFAMFVMSKLAKMKRACANIDMHLMRHYHKKLFPLHLVLQSILAINAIVFALLFVV